MDLELGIINEKKFERHSKFFILMIVEGQSSPLKFLPIQIFLALSLHNHVDAVVNRTYNFTEVTSHTFFFFY